MKGRRGNSCRLCLSLSWLLLTTIGCSFAIRDYELQEVSSPKIPLRVGLYMAPSFRNYLDNRIQLGEGMRKGAEEAARKAFEDVVMIDSLSSAEIPRREIKAIASPEIVGAGIVLDPTLIQTSIRYQITVKWTIWSPDGKIIYMNTFRGEGISRAHFPSIETSTTLAAKEQYDKFLAHIVSHRWWEAIK